MSTVVQVQTLLTRQQNTCLTRQRLVSRHITVNGTAEKHAASGYREEYRTRAGSEDLVSATVM